MKWVLAMALMIVLTGCSGVASRRLKAPPPEPSGSSATLAAPGSGNPAATGGGPDSAGFEKPGCGAAAAQPGAAAPDFDEDGTADTLQGPTERMGPEPITVLAGDGRLLGQILPIGYDQVKAIQPPVHRASAVWMGGRWVLFYENGTADARRSVAIFVHTAGFVQAVGGWVPRGHAAVADDLSFAGDRITLRRKLGDVARRLLVITYCFQGDHVVAESSRWEPEGATLREPVGDGELVLAVFQTLTLSQQAPGANALAEVSGYFADPKAGEAFYREHEAAIASYAAMPTMEAFEGGRFTIKWQGYESSLTATGTLKARDGKVVELKVERYQ